MGFEFQTPWVLGLLALLPFYALLRGRVGPSPAIVFSSAALVREVGHRVRGSAGAWRSELRLVALAAGIVALAGPRLASRRDEILASGVDVMLVLDLSWSMAARDMGVAERTVSRIDAARSVLRDFIRRRPSDRLGLVVFSAVPYLACPPTLNHGWLEQNLDRLHVGLLSELGTAIGDAAAVALRRLQSLRQSRSRVIILLTDGDQNRGTLDPVAAADLAAGLGTRIHTVGLGREEPCALPAFDPDTGDLRLDAAGRTVPVMTLQPADFRVLGRMARAAGGRFFRADSQAELERIYDEIDGLEKTEVRVRRHTEHVPLFQWPLLAALGAFGVEMARVHVLRRPVP